MEKTTGYWYLDDPDLFEFEKQGFKKFCQDYGKDLPGLKIKMGFHDKKFVVSVEFPFRTAKNAAPMNWKFLLEYADNHPSKDEDGTFGGSIKAYVLNDMDHNFHHLMGKWSEKPYVCQARERTSDKVTGYYTMNSLIRYAKVYAVWKETGVDTDRH